MSLVSVMLVSLICGSIEIIISVCHLIWVLMIGHYCISSLTTPLISVMFLSLICGSLYQDWCSCILSDVNAYCLTSVYFITSDSVFYHKQRRWQRWYQCDSSAALPKIEICVSLMLVFIIWYECISSQATPFVSVMLVSLIRGSIKIDMSVCRLIFMLVIWH